MAVKSFSIDGIGTITIYKKRGVKRLNLRIDGDKIRVTQPLWLPYSSGIHFVSGNKQWIVQQFKKQPDNLLKHGMLIGKERILRFERGASLRSRINENSVTIYLPNSLPSYSEQAQLIAKKAAKKSLKKEADECLPQRLAVLADKYGFSYHSVKSKSMHSRWGSCSSKKDITLSIYLMMLPWEMIDYVLLHELVHTEHLHHAPSFWQTLADIMPDYKDRRKTLKKLQSLVSPLR